MKGAIATQVGRVVFKNFKVADNGGGPAASASKVNGKDHGGGIEMAWLVDGAFPDNRAEHGHGRAVQAEGWLKAPRFNARNCSTKTPVSSAGFNWELAPLQHGEVAARQLGDMAGVENALIVGRSEAGRVGTAGKWNTARGRAVQA